MTPLPYLDDATAKCGACGSIGDIMIAARERALV